MYSLSTKPNYLIGFQKTTTQYHFSTGNHGPAKPLFSPIFTAAVLLTKTDWAGNLYHPKVSSSPDVVQEVKNKWVKYG